MSLMLNDELALGNDNNYKNFIITIEKVLKNFENSNEWPDLITNLVKLKKTIGAYSKFKSIPKRLTLSKRLAQCLHPALPSGVHLKALEVYEIIFQTIDKHFLQRDIILYSYGLFSLLPVAALPVKAALLTLYETYFLPLGDALNPILTGFLIGLLSTLEEGSDYYHRVIRLLNDLANRIDEFYFYICIWSTTDLVATVRYSAVSFILSNFDKTKPMESQTYLIGVFKETTVNAICTCLYDDQQTLVQRVILDLILNCLPIHKDYLTKSYMMKIMIGSFNILLKRDASLSRRVFTWLLGTHELYKPMINDLIDPSSSYFTKYTREILIESLRNVLDAVSKNCFRMNNVTDENDKIQITNITDRKLSTWSLIKLIRVLLVLVAQSEIGPNIIESIFMNYSLIIYEQIYKPLQKLSPVNTEQENICSETLKAFNMLLDTLEPCFIWGYFIKNIDAILNQQQNSKSTTIEFTFEQILNIINMTIDIFLHESSTDLQSEHLPEILYRLIKVMNNNIEKFTANQIILSIETLLKILKIIIPIRADINHYHLSLFNRSIESSCEILENTSNDSDTDDKTVFLDDDYSTHVYYNLMDIDESNKSSSNVRQNDIADIENLLHLMVRKVEKQIYKLDAKSSNGLRTRLSTKSLLESINQIEKSIKLYKAFFHRFIYTFIIDKAQMIEKEKFQNLFNIIHDRTGTSLSTLFCRFEKFNQFQLILNENVGEYEMVFEDCCKLLIELSNYPVSQSLSLEDTEGKIELEDCAMDLLVLSLCSYKNFHVRTNVLYVLIEIFDDIFCRKTRTNRLFRENQINVLLHETEYFQHIISYLWEYLSEKYDREINTKSANILSILHSILPNNVCDNLICQQLKQMNVERIDNDFQLLEQYKRFLKLWNSTRQGSSRIKETPVKSYQSCLIHTLTIFKQSNNYRLKSFIQQWIYDCFIHEDTCRILDKLLIMLLESDTTRIYLKPIESNINEIVSDEIDDKYFYDYDFDNEQQTSANLDELTSSQKLFTSSMKFSLIITRSLTPPMLLKSVKNRAATMSNVFHRNNIQSESNSIGNNTLQSQSVPNDNILNDSLLSTIDNTKTCRNTYILLYRQPFDYERIKLSLTIIHSLIDLLPEHFINILLTTSNIQSSIISPYNNYMHELFHKQCNFIDENLCHLSDDQAQKYQSYLYLLMQILVTFTNSYYSSCYNIEHNRQIHILSLQILTRICHNLSSICLNNSILINYIVNLLKKISFQNVILHLFNRMIDRNNDLSKQNIIYNADNDLLYEYLTKLIEEIILLENIIDSNDKNLILKLLVDQNLFLSTIIYYLKQIFYIENHYWIINFIIRILPHCGSALKKITIRVIEQICRNLCFIIQHNNQEKIKLKFSHLSSFDPINYIIYMIQRLSYIFNYCLGNSVNSSQYYIETLCPQHWMTKIRVDPKDLQETRQLILNKFPLILSTLVSVWKIEINSVCLTNHMKQIREKIINFISSLIKTNSLSFIRSIVYFFAEIKRQNILSNSLHSNTSKIEALINILFDINNYTMNDMIYNINEFIQNQSNTNEKTKQNYIIWCLQFILIYIEQKKMISIDCWSVLCSMLKECLFQTTATCSSVNFLIIKILNYYVKQSSLSLNEKRDLQETIMKVLEYCNSTIVSSPEQTKSTRKTLQFRSESDLMSSNNDLINIDEYNLSSNSNLYSLKILCENAAKLLDIVFSLNDENDRQMVTYLQNLSTNLFPYVRKHVASNELYYRLTSTLIRNLSHYFCVQKTWKKDIFEQLFDVDFFHIDLSTLRLWKIIVLNVITNEKLISFRDIINRINTVQTSLFASKEQEYEQRSMLIKRFSFIIYSSEKDQYNRHLPIILDFIVELLKLPQIPTIYTQIFLLLRVLIIRISSKNLISFWPILMTELIQILLQIEQDLLLDTHPDNKFYVQRMTTTDMTLANSLTTNSTLKMYLYACKLLDILLSMPYSDLYHFQFFRSAFITEHEIMDENLNNHIFISYSIRLTNLFHKKYETKSVSQSFKRPFLRFQTISSLIDLYPFLNYLSKIHCYDNFYSINSDILNDIETSVLEDFVESWL